MINHSLPLISSDSLAGSYFFTSSSTGNSTGNSIVFGYKEQK